MLEKRENEGNYSNNKVKLGGRTKFVEILVHYNIYKENVNVKKV